MFQPENEIKTGEKLSPEHCRKVLNQDGLNYTDEEVTMIRDYLYAMAEIDYLYFTEEVLKKETLTQNQKKDETGDSLHPGEYRRAS
jgi:hypothetical protein